jgi:hypothetical protein
MLSSSILGGGWALYDRSQWKPNPELSACVYVSSHLSSPAYFRNVLRQLINTRYDTLE